MRGPERWFVLWATCYMIAYIPIFFLIPTYRPSLVWPVMMPLHFLGMIQNFMALILTLRDLYLRHFPQPNQKVTWCLLILCTGGIGWIVYLFKYAFKPRVLSS